MPKLAIDASKTAVSSRFKLAFWAIGAAYFIASPKSSNVCAELFAAAVITSQTRPICDASSPNCRRVFPAISVAVGISVPVARAKSITPAILSFISVAEKPARPNAAIPEPTSLAVQLVVRPSFLACSVNSSNALPVAPLTACVSRIWSSKSANVLTASASGVASVAAPKTVDAPNAPALELKERKRLSAERNALLKLESFTPNSTKARPALIPAAVAIYRPVVLLRKSASVSFGCSCAISRFICSRICFNRNRSNGL